MSDKELSVFEGNKDLAVREQRVGQGSENVSATDMAIPRIKLLQAISDEVSPGNPKQIEGATAGMIMNSVSNELYSGLFLINLHFSRKTVVWKKRKAGGGMFGSYESEEEAKAAIAESGEPAENFDISENPTHLVLLISENGEPKGVALLDMPGTKIKVSKKWNSLIHEAEKEGNPRFGCVWQLSVTSESNTQGNYFNYDVKQVAVAPDDIYNAAESAYDAFFYKPAEEAPLEEAA